MSESLLLELGLDQSEVSGFVFQEPGEAKSIGTKAARSHILCCRHNTALGPLDDRAKQLGQALRALVLLGHPDVPRPSESRSWLFNGHDIERWVVKVLAGAMAAGQVRRREERAGTLPVPSDLLDVLFGEKILTSPAGLYFIGRMPTLAKRDFGARAVWDPEYRAIIGMEVRIHAIDMLLWLSDRQPQLSGFDLQYRPAGKFSWREDKYVAIDLRWIEAGSPMAEIVHLPRTGSPVPDYHTNNRWSHWGRPPTR